jgi:hypothetical protein
LAEINRFHNLHQNFGGDSVFSNRRGSRSLRDCAFKQSPQCRLLSSYHNFASTPEMPRWCKRSMMQFAQRMPAPLCSVGLIRSQTSCGTTQSPTLA